MWVKKILVATDFTESSQAAADIGLEFAQSLRVPLVLLHTYPVLAPIYAGIPMAPADDYARLYEQAAREALEKERARLVTGGAEVVPLLKPGVAWEEILSAAEQFKADLIIVGTHGRRGLPRAVLGSVAEKVVRLSPIPVLTVHARPEAGSPKSS
jgi:nucleotide-binding universal stress UspA family protein